MVTQFNTIRMKMTKQYFIFPTMSLLTVFLLFGCGKYKEFADTDYPDQVIYLPSAGKLFQITDPADPYEAPTPGQPYRFRIDESANKVIIPMGIVRGGISNAGSVTIDISNRSDTVNTLIDEGTLTAQLLPQSAYTIPPSITLPDGKDAVTFDLVIDLPFLQSHPDETFAIAVHISSKERQTNPKKETTIVVFNTNLLDQ